MSEQHSPYVELDRAAWARLADDVDWDAVLRAFRERGRARASVMAWVHGPEGEVVAELEARFALLRPA